MVWAIVLIVVIPFGLVALGLVQAWVRLVERRWER
jgi:hypothetical protein